MCCRAPPSRWCSSLGSCRRSCWRISRALSTLLLPLGDRRRLVERLGCCCRRASTSSWRRGAPLGSRLCWTSSAVYSVAQLPPSVCTTLATAMLQFMCCHAIWTVSFARAALATVCIPLAAPTWRGTSVPRLFQGAHTAKRQQVHGLGGWALTRPSGACLRRAPRYLVLCGS